jgi:hypothetical protein
MNDEAVYSALLFKAVKHMDVIRDSPVYDAVTPPKQQKG